MGNDLVGYREDSMVAPVTERGIEAFVNRLRSARMLPVVGKGETMHPDVAFGIIMRGASLGLNAFTSLDSIANVNGKYVLWGDGALGIIQASGLLEDMEESIQRNSKNEVVSATCIMKRKGRKSPITQIFTVEMARKAGLLGKPGPWSQYPERMLQMRARSWAMRDGFSDVLKGLSIGEDVQDFSTQEPIQESTQDRKPNRLIQAAVATQMIQEEQHVIDDEFAPDSSYQTNHALGLAQLAASKGVEAYKTLWSQLSPEGKRALASEHEGLKAIAQQVDAKKRQLEPEPVVEQEAQEPVIQQEPIVEQEPEDLSVMENF